jgi:hypothetical protein
MMATGSFVTDNDTSRIGVRLVGPLPYVTVTPLQVSNAVPVVSLARCQA